MTKEMWTKPLMELRSEFLKTYASYEKRLNELEKIEEAGFTKLDESMKEHFYPQKEQPKDEVTRVKIGDTLYPGKKYEVLVDIPEQPKETDMENAIENFFIDIRQFQCCDHESEIRNHLETLLKSQESSTREEIRARLPKGKYDIDYNETDYWTGWNNYRDSVLEILGIKV